MLHRKHAIRVSGVVCSYSRRKPHTCRKRSHLRHDRCAGRRTVEGPFRSSCSSTPRLFVQSRTSSSWLRLIRERSCSPRLVTSSIALGRDALEPASACCGRSSDFGSSALPEAKESQNEKYDDHEANDIDDAIHENSSGLGSRAPANELSSRPSPRRKQRTADLCVGRTCAPRRPVPEGQGWPANRDPFD